jgi:4'-phosphopantetheinyl transferase
MKQSGPSWSICNHPWDLSPELIHVWRVSLDQSMKGLEGLKQLLSNDEKDRAGRFHFERDRHRFSLARGALRAVLGRYLNIGPGKITFDYGPQGKPSLAIATPPLRFNVSHSRDLALIAVSYGRDLGVDVEFVRSLAQGERIFEHFFSPREVETLRSLPEHLQERCFFACWTRKEAYMKACGGGLSIPLDGFEVSVDPREPPALLGVQDDPSGPLSWGMEELRPADGYIAALVAQGKDWRCCCHDWDEAAP